MKKKVHIWAIFEAFFVAENSRHLVACLCNGAAARVHLFVMDIFGIRYTCIRYYR